MNEVKIKFSIVLILIIVYGCTPYLTEFDKEVYEQIYDFTEYTSKEFLFSPEQYLGSFESCGIIKMEFWPEVVKSYMLQPGQFYSEGEGKNWIFKSITSKEILDSLYNKAKRLGADAIVRLQIEKFEGDYGPVTAPCKRVSGFAIKRK